MLEGRIAYLNARLLDPETGLDQTGALLVEDGLIADFGAHLFRTGAPSVNEVIDCQGKCLAPGLIDVRVQLREPGEEHKETLASASLAASHGGITTLVQLPNTNPVIDDVPVLEFVARRSRELKRTKIYCYGALTKGLEGREISEIGLLSEAGAVAFTDGERALADAKVMRRAMSYGKAFDALIVQHPEEPSLAGSGVMNNGELASKLGLSGIPPVAEVIMIERDLRLLEGTGGRLHFAHVTTAAAIEAIRKAKAAGMNVTCDTAPHYFALNELAIGDYRTFAKVSPPLRSEEDRQAVIAGLADGTIDIVASDHAPHDQDSKRLPFDEAAFGVIGLETLLPMVLSLYHNSHLGLIEALALVTTHPAKRFGLTGGCLKRGAPADLVLFDLDKPWKIDEDKMHSKSKNSAFGGRPVQGKVLRTVVDGRPLFAADGF
ncbi:MAG: dihydroorotase [Rhodospirillaceae bacterium]|jgi:dihydroorotase|uniref:dihydroorotase n=1 Tax=unclassified Hwanghaeella TaxID=2605944 RepID=UPI000C43547D|nr:dihydroorotase [Rhodospirillales bacterium]MAX48322.1 dihydroorotase [Rhodospirillaceae bacterium]|tara:strand:- start:44700 stop:46001 length:1302 start_codon:yes stop_codon:yes gene_type:complete